MAKPFLFVFGALLACATLSQPAHAKEPSSFKVCGMLESMQYQADQWADLAADGKCALGHAKRLGGFTHRYVDNADNGKCSDNSDTSNCVYYSGGWEACAVYSCR